MTRDLTRLAVLAALKKDAACARLEQARALHDRLADRLEGLTTPQPDDPGICAIVMARAQLRYQLWADGQRALLNQALARQKVELERLQTEARPHIGRATVLDQLCQRSGHRR
jgi:hypothetical protein